MSLNSNSWHTSTSSISTKTSESWSDVESLSDEVPHLLATPELLMAIPHTPSLVDKAIHGEGCSISFPTQEVNISRRSSTASFSTRLSANNLSSLLLSVLDVDLDESTVPVDSLPVDTKSGIKGFQKPELSKLGRLASENKMNVKDRGVVLNKENVLPKATFADDNESGVRTNETSLSSGQKIIGQRNSVIISSSNTRKDMPTECTDNFVIRRAKRLHRSPYHRRDNYDSLPSLEDLSLEDIELSSVGLKKERRKSARRASRTKLCGGGIVNLQAPRLRTWNIATALS